MPRRAHVALLTRIEEILLLVVRSLEPGAYGVRIRARAQRVARRQLSIGSVYTPLARLEKRGLLTAREGEPSPVRGGRRKRFYELTARGWRALRRTRRVTDRAWAQKRASRRVKPYG
jgi:DNA-binding PadR family transcriptional regulator